MIMSYYLLSVVHLCELGFGSRFVAYDSVCLIQAQSRSSSRINRCGGIGNCYMPC